MRIDAHQHFWKFHPVKNSWIKDDMKAIQKDFLPADLEPLLAQNDFGGCIAVQADQAESETDFLISLATGNDCIKGVVGWVDLQAADLTKRLAHYKACPIVKGFRHVLQGEPQRDLMLQPAFTKGIAALQHYGFTYDLLILPDQVTFSTDLVTLFPEQKFVLDHLAKPYIRRREIAQWRNDIELLGAHENVFCKLSGMVTEAHWHSSKKEDFRSYIDVVINAFGIDRIMFGSDWPVCLVAASYREVVDIVEDYFLSFSKDEQDKIFGSNAETFYGL